MSEIHEFGSNKSARIFQIPIEAFPDFWAYAYLVIVDDYRVLIDTGSGFGDSSSHLDEGMKQAGARLNGEIAYTDLTHILITHGHIDHFGGLAHVRPLTQAKLGIHELDRRNLTCYEERLVVVSQRLKRYLLAAGVSPKRCANLLEMYMLPKALFNSVNVDFTYEDIGMKLGPFEMFHVPGHCAGHVIIRLHDVLFSGDHILSGISPHQAPEQLTLNTGLGHYLNSLDQTLLWADGINLTLGGHRAVINDLAGRIIEIRELHDQRFEEVLDILCEPQTIAQVSRKLFGDVSGYNVLLALEEAGAHIEYLYQHGLLGISNLSDLENGDDKVPILYYRLS